MNTELMKIAERYFKPSYSPFCKHCGMSKDSHILESWHCLRCRTGGKEWDNSTDLNASAREKAVEMAERLLKAAWLRGIPPIRTTLEPTSGWLAEICREAEREVGK